MDRFLAPPKGRGADKWGTPIGYELEGHTVLASPSLLQAEFIFGVQTIGN